MCGMMSQEGSLFSRLNPLNRRHSIQVLLPSVQIQIEPAKNRRRSLTASLQSLSKSMSKVMHLGSTSSALNDGKQLLTKSFLQTLLSQHFRRADLKVSKLSVKCLKNEDRLERVGESTLTALLLRQEEKGGGDLESWSCLWFQGHYQIEVWIKYESVKRKLCLIALWPPKQTEESIREVEVNGGSDGPNDQDIFSSHKECSENGLLDVRKSSRPRLAQINVSDSDGLSSSCMEKISPAPSNIGRRRYILSADKERRFEAEREYKVVTQLIRDLVRFLQTEKGVTNAEDLLSLPTSYKCDASMSSKFPLAIRRMNSSDPTMVRSFYNDLLIMDDSARSGFRMASMDRDENGLDYAHTVLVIERLAAFHAASFVFKIENCPDLEQMYEFLNQDPVYRQEAWELFQKTQTNISTRLRNIFQQQNVDDCIKEYSAYFMDAVQNWFDVQSKLIRPLDDKFGVICHGDLWRQNILYSYAGPLESQSEVLDIRLTSLKFVRYSSCMTDLGFFLFTSVDSEVRRDHALHLLMVYHDHFSKTVNLLAKDKEHVHFFSRQELLAEFQRTLLFGFLEALSMFSTAYESHLHRAESMDGFVDEREHPRYQDYRDTVLALIVDVIKINFMADKLAADLSPI